MREYHLSNQIVFSSFNHDSVSLLAEIAPEIPRAILYDTPLTDPLPKQNIEKQVDYIQTSSY